MRALTVRQPYAHLIATGQKRIETRSWPTHHRGALAIHAALGAWPHPTGGGLTDLPRGAVVAVCTLETVIRFPARRAELRALVRRHSGAPREMEYGYFGAGRYGWVLRDARPLAVPVPARGRLMLWHWEPPPGAVW